MNDELQYVSHLLMKALVSFNMSIPSPSGPYGIVYP